MAAVEHLAQVLDVHARATRGGLEACVPEQVQRGLAQAAPVARQEERLFAALASSGRTSR
jgi:hypothetical protein